MKMKEDFHKKGEKHFLKKTALLYTLPLVLFIVGMGGGHYALFFLKEGIKVPITLGVSLFLMVGAFTLLKRYTKIKRKKEEKKRG